ERLNGLGQVKSDDFGRRVLEQRLEDVLTNAAANLNRPPAAHVFERPAVMVVAIVDVMKLIGGIRLVEDAMIQAAASIDDAPLVIPTRVVAGSHVDKPGNPQPHRIGLSTW